MRSSQGMEARPWGLVHDDHLAVATARQIGPRVVSPGEPDNISRT